MRLFYTILLFLFCAFTINAQTLTISDAETDETLPMVVLMSENPMLYLTTNAAGQVDISAFKNAETIHVSMVGYEKKQTTFKELASLDFKLALSPANLSIDEVVVAATRWRQPSNNVPSKIVSITAKEITLQNPQTAADLLSVSGRVYIQKSQQGGGSPMIRGFATNRLLYSVDGVRMNTAIFRGGNVQNVISLDPYAVENTEVLFGAGSVIYGSDAIGGVMSFQTLTPQLSYSDKPLVTGKANTRFSSANMEKSAHADINVGFKKWAFVSSFSYWDYDNLRQGSNGPDDYIKAYHVEQINGIDSVVPQTGKDELLQIPTAYSQWNTMQKIRFTPNNNWDFQYAFHYSETSPYGRYDRHNRVKNGTARYAEWNYGPQQWMMNNLTINHTGKHEVYDNFTLRMAHQKFEESRISRNFRKPDRETQTENVDAYSINLDFVKNLNDKNVLYYGGEYVLNEVRSQAKTEDIETNISSAIAPRYPKANWCSWAGYLNHETKLSDKVTLHEGIRFSQFELNATFDTTLFWLPFNSAEISNRALTGTAGLVIRPEENLIITTNFSTAFRSPNVDDVGKIFDSEPGSLVVPNNDLESEYAYNLDLGIAKKFGDILKVDLTGYYTLLQNALVRRDFQLNGQDSILFNGEMSRIQAIQNAAHARVYGVQAGFDAKLPLGFGMSGDANYQKGEEELDDGTMSPMRHAAPFFGTVRGTYTYKKLFIKLYTTFQGEKSHDELAEDEKEKDEIYALDKNGQTYSPAWYTLNLKAMYRIHKNLTLTAGIENITDQRYRPYSSGVSAAGRNYIVALKATF